MTASRLFSSLTPSPSCRHIKTTSSQVCPKPYSKRQLPGGLFYSGSQPTVEYQEMSKRTSWQKEGARGEQHGNNASFSEKTFIRVLTMPRSQRNDYHLLSREQQVVLVRLRNEHIRLNSHMHRKLKLAPSPTCICGQGDQTTEDVLLAPYTKIQEKMCGLSALP